MHLILRYWQLLSKESFICACWTRRRFKPWRDCLLLLEVLYFIYSCTRLLIGFFTIVDQVFGSFLGIFEGVVCFLMTDWLNCLLLASSELWRIHMLFVLFPNTSVVISPVCLGLASWCLYKPHWKCTTPAACTCFLTFASVTKLLPCSLLSISASLARNHPHPTCILLPTAWVFILPHTLKPEHENYDLPITPKTALFSLSRFSVKPCPTILFLIQGHNSWHSCEKLYLMWSCPWHVIHNWMTKWRDKSHHTILF